MPVDFWRINWISLLAPIWLIVSCGNDIDVNTGATDEATSVTSCNGKSYCYLFTTNSTVDMDFASGSDVLTELDNLCDADVNNPRQNEGVVKAVFAWSGSREACTTAHCAGGVTENLNWVLRAETEYRRSDGTIIGTTDTSGIFDFLNSGYSFTSSISATYVSTLTSLSTNWLIYRSSCTNFTDSSGSPAPSYGASTSKNEGMIYVSFEINCSGSHHIICAEQL
ncbi:MAG: DUF1554 domain-containing protein [Bacteriovoracaceae bacterium]|nr:DUF1554 domain-containing protein [Bacteriovoracaceae bacterium]